MALARALAVEPTVLLLDEPFGALDAKVRKELRDWLRRLHDEVHVTTVFVTHDQEEALEVADEIVVINEGRVEQVGTPDQLYDEPANDFVMSFLGEVTHLAGDRGPPARHRRLDRRRCSPAPSRAPSPGCCGSASRCASPCSPWTGEEVSVVMTRTHARSLGSRGGQHRLADRGGRRDRRTVDARRRWRAERGLAEPAVTPRGGSMVAVPRSDRRRGGGGYRAQVKVMDPLDELWAGIEAFDEDAADRALVGLLWDVPLGEAADPRGHPVPRAAR